jgi:hypothetical protein
MHYRLNIGQEGVMRLHNTTAHDKDELLTLIKSNAQYDDVIQVEIIEELAVLDGFTAPPRMTRVGSFASYYNGRADLIELMEIFHCTGRGYDLHNEINRLAKEQAVKLNTIHFLLGGNKEQLRASIERTAQQRGCSLEEEMERLLNHLQQTA